MKENKNTELDGESLNTDALYAPQVEKVKEASEIIEDTTEPEINKSEPQKAYTHVSPPVSEKRKKEKQKKVRAPKEPKPLRAPLKPAVPISEPTHPLFVCTVTFAISLLALIIDKFIYPFSNELLAPVILQIVALIVPAYLSMMITSRNKSIGAQFKEIGVRAIKAEHVFFMIFTSLFTMCAALVLTLTLGGANDAARGITLLGTFTAGVNEYTVSYPYLLLAYVLLPAIAEEMLFRGVIFAHLEKISFPLAAVISCAMCSLYGFSLGGLISSLFVSVMLVFVLYTTGSLVCCVIVHILVNLYKLFLEANISAYFISSQNNFLLLLTIAVALAISALLFFSESVRIYRAKAKNIAEGKEKSANRHEEFKKLFDEIRSTLAYKPSLICAIACAVIFVTVAVINYLT